MTFDGQTTAQDEIPSGYVDRPERYETISVDIRDNGQTWIELRRPERLNAFNRRMMLELRSAVWDANFDSRVRVVVITGQGRGFCAGRDIQELGEQRAFSPPRYRAWVRANHLMFDDFEALEKPIVAAVNGPCAGGGVEMATSCDLRVASTEATFSLPEIRIGVLPASGACSRMIQMIGISRVKEMVMTGRTFSAEEAYRIGLVDHLAPPEELLDKAAEVAERFTQGSPSAIGLGKHLINMCQNVDTDTGRMLERLAQSSLVHGEDSQEGLAAFREKRAPRFTGD